MAKARKGLGPAARHSQRILLTNIGSESERRWKRVMRHVPLAAEDRACLIPDLHLLCEGLVNARRDQQRSAAMAAAVRRYGGKGSSPLEQVSRSLRTTTRAWKEIKDTQEKIVDIKNDPTFGGVALRDIRSDPFGDFALLDSGLPAMAEAAQRLFRFHRKLGKPIPLRDPWPPFVRKVAACLDKTGAPPTVSGSNPTWFQKFMHELQIQLLGKDGKPAKEKAFYSDIARIMRGFRNQVARNGGIPR